MDSAGHVMLTAIAGRTVVRPDDEAASPATDAITLRRCSTPTRAIPPRGRQVDVAAEPANRLGESGCSTGNSLTFGAVDVSWTPPLRNVSFTDNKSSC
jgi:hypothetical protein